jgi:hypothetical protein
MTMMIVRRRKVEELHYEKSYARNATVSLKSNVSVRTMLSLFSKGLIMGSNGFAVTNLADLLLPAPF